MRRFILTVEGADYQVEVSNGAVLVNGRPFHVEISGQKVIVDGSEYTVELDHNVAWVNGFPYALQLQDNGTPVIQMNHGQPVQVVHPPPAAPSAADSDRVVVAAMPGKVLRVLVKEGDTIRIDDVVCILEAMKMENELRAHRAGTVRRVLVRPGQDVQAGEPLVVIA